MNEQRFVVSDILWQRLEPHLPGKVSDAGVTAKDNRMFLEAVFWRVRTGSPWRDLPPAFGHWNSQFRRFRRWARAGVFESLFKAMSDDRRPRIRAYRWNHRSGPPKGNRRKRGTQTSGHRALARRIND